MALLQCEICGGKLTMKPGGVCECCDCGMGYDKEWIKEQVAAINTEKRESSDVKSNVGAKATANDNKDRLATIRERIASLQHTFAVSPNATIGLRLNGTVVMVGNNAWGQCKVSGWSNIAAISGSYYHTVGLRSDGTVVAAGEPDDDGKCKVSGWKNIRAVFASMFNTVGLQSDGSVVVAGSRRDGRSDVDDWADVVTIACDNQHIVGLRSDGTVMATGEKIYGICDVSDWTDIVAIACGKYRTVGLRSNGTVVAVGDNQDGQCNVDGWTDIVAIACGKSHTVGLRSNGTVIATGDDSAGQSSNVGIWTDIVAIACGEYFTVGLRADGSVAAAGYNADGREKVGTWDSLGGWTDVVAIACGDAHTVGLRSDGTMVAVGSNRHGQCNVNGWKLFDELSEVTGGNSRVNTDADECNEMVSITKVSCYENEHYSVEQEMRQMQHLRAELLAKKLVDRYCEQFNSSLRGKKEWNSFKEQYDEYSRDFMCYLLAFYAVERAKYKTYEKYWRDYLTGDASCTDIRSLISQAEQSLDVRMVIGDVSSGNFEELAAEYKFPYTNSAGVDSSIFVHKYLHAVIKNELVLTYINELNANDIFKELSVDEALAYMKFSTSDDYKGNIFMKVTAVNS